MLREISIYRRDPFIFYDKFDNYSLFNRNSSILVDPLVTKSSENDAQERETRDDLFDKIIGHIEDLIMEDGFQSIQQHYLDKYWKVFEPVEENKLLYMDVFNEYNKAIESYIDTSLKKLIPTFSMNDFISELLKRRSELEGEVFEVLLTFTDFLAFKELILDYRALQEGKVQDLSSGITVKSLSISNFETKSCY